MCENVRGGLPYRPKYHDRRLLVGDSIIKYLKACRFTSTSPFFQIEGSGNDGSQFSFTPRISCKRFWVDLSLFLSEGQGNELRR
jgi:hypothetical protein